MILSKITSNQRLRDDATLSYLRMRRDGLPAGVTSAHRPADEQQDLYDKYRSGNGNFALPPDQSNHVKGIALDLPAAPRAWVREHGRKYGWTPVANEPWHFNYNPNLDQMAQEDDMTPEESQMLKDTLAQIQWTNKRLSGSAANESITSLLQRACGAVTDGENTALQWSHWTGKRVGGSTDNAGLTALLQQVAAQNQAIIDALSKGTTPAPTIDYAQLAKAVNDDAAKRMAQ